jgi:hypothetical protein
MTSPSLGRRRGHLECWRGIAALDTLHQSDGILRAMFVLEALWKWLVVAGSMRLGDADRIQSSDDSEHSKGAYMVNQSQDHVGYAHGTNDSYFFTLLMTLVGHWRSISVWRSAWDCLRLSA